MKKSAVLCVLILLLSSLPLCMTAKHEFTHYDMSNGLSHNTVLAIAQDKSGFMWFGTKNGLNRFDGHFFKKYYADTLDRSLKSDYINALCLGPDNRLWVGTDAGLFVYDTKQDRFERFEVKTKEGKTIGSIVNIIIASDNCVYISCFPQGIFCYNTESGELTNNEALGSMVQVTSMAVDESSNLWVWLYSGDIYTMKGNLSDARVVTTPDGKGYFANTKISGIVVAEQGQLFVSTEMSGVSLVNINTGSVSSIMPNAGQKGLFTHSLLRSGNEIWAATEDGLYVYEMFTHEVEHYYYEPTNPFSLSDNPIQSLFCDRNGGLWAGTYFGGVNYSPHKVSNFDSFFPRADKENSLHGRRVREIVEDNQGIIWIGTEDGGLNRYDHETNTISFIAESAAFPNIHGLCADGDILWIGTFSFGLKMLDTRTGKVVKSFQSEGKDGTLKDNDIFSVSRSRSGKMYFGTLSGVCTYEDGYFHYLDGLPNTIVYDVSEDTHGNLWVGTYGHGVYLRPAKSQEWTVFNVANQSLASNNVLNIYESKNGVTWVTTENGGVYCYRQGKLQYVPIPKDSPRRMVFGLIEDKLGKLWLTTNDGLICYDQKTEESHIYTTANGLLDNNFNYKSTLFARNGNIYAGSLSGFVKFNPVKFNSNAIVANIVATELQINNNIVDNHCEDSPIKENITAIKTLRLEHSQNSFALRVSPLLFGDNRETQMEYMLEGFDKSWQRLRYSTPIHYTNLPSGKYKLIVRLVAQDEDTVCPPYELEVIVLPPFYFSWWAWIIYIIMSIVFAYASWRFLTQRSEMHRRLAMEKFEHEKEQELYQSKISFFTNVAHEIRTPLTLIKAPLENILKKKIEDKSAKEDLNIMDQNVNRLLELTNQLLDFRKAERDGLKLNFERCNINKLVQGVYVRFTSLMREKGIESTIDMPEEPIYAYVDKESVTKVVSNLINNAVKYCDTEIFVELKHAGDNVEMVLRNDGKLIPKTMRESIFTPFVRGEEVPSNVAGTGIGLALARTMTELHNGSLKMLDDKKYNVFSLSLPINQTNVVGLSEDIPEVSSGEQEETVAVEDSAPKILVVEDNLQMQQYEKQKLQHYYKVFTANNGEEALAILKNQDVDAIVSDAMMEPMDGFKLCRAVKEDVNISHIPFILLTALTLDSAKIEGMEAGADSYIEKPFSMDYLLSTIKNLLRARQNAKTAYAQSPFIQSQTVTISRMDEKFLKRLETVMEKNLSNSDFDITMMAREMCMSRTGLNRKIRGIFDLTPNNYIKIERLKRAAMLMKTDDYKVNEVCYMVGFTSPSYFTQCFYKQFGLLPKDFISTDIK